MQCHEVHNLLDDYLDGHLEHDRCERLHAHLDACAACREELAFRRELLTRLRRLPIEAPAPGFATRALQRARQRHTQRRRGFLAGFGSAVAAGLALWAIVGLWQPPTPTTGTAGLHTVTLQVQQVRTVRLAFNVPQRFDRVRFHLQLPPGVSLANRPGEREIAWEDRLEPGRNLLTLPLKADRRLDGELVARIEVDGKEKVFRLPLRAVAAGAGKPPAKPLAAPARHPSSRFINV